MFICKECGAHLDTPYEQHECDQLPKVKYRGNEVQDSLPKRQIPEAVRRARAEREWREWDMN